MIFRLLSVISNEKMINETPDMLMAFIVLGGIT